MKLKSPNQQQLTKNFKRTEFDCNNAVQTPVPSYYYFNMLYCATILQLIRDLFELSFIRINSAYRTASYNSAVGGSRESNHLTASAVDIWQPNYSNKDFHMILKSAMENGLIPYGELIYYETFIHYAPDKNDNFFPRTITTNEFNKIYSYPMQSSIKVVTAKNIMGKFTRLSPWKL